MRYFVLSAWIGFGFAVVNAGEGVFWREEQLYPSLPIAVDGIGSRQCREDSGLVLQHLRNKTLWAMRMQDSSAKAPDGVIYGSIFQMGNFDECISTIAPVKVQFCMAQVYANIPKNLSNPADPFSLEPDPAENVWSSIRASRLDPSKIPRDVVNWGLCLPASCSTEDLEKGINMYLNGINDRSADVTFNVEIKQEFCTAADEYDEVSVGEISFWCFAFLLVFLTLSSTIADKREQTESLYRKLWMAFSIKRNKAKLYGSSEEPGKHNRLKVLHGVKALSIICIVLGHRVGISLSVSTTNFEEIEHHVRSAQALFFVHTDLVVDTFFFISGLLACFFLLSVFSQRFVNPLFAISVRLLRLSPVYFFVVWYQASAASRFGSGPLWKALGKGENGFCAENWWTNLLYVNNYVKPKEMCMTHSWYIPCDLHFFAAATLIAMLLVRHKKIGLAFLSSLIVISAIIPALVTYYNQVQPMIIFYHDFLSNPRGNETFDILYVKSHNRAAVYLIGMMVGFFLHMNQNSIRRISATTTGVILFCWLGFIFAPMAYGSLYYTPGRAYNPIESAIFSSARRISWALGFTLFVLAHRFGNLSFMRRILSSKVAIFVSNITYGIYLVHFNLIVADVVQIRSPKPFEIGAVLMSGIGDLLRSGFLAVVLFFILEVPSKRIFRDILLFNDSDLKSKELQQQQLESCNNNCSLDSTQTHSIKL